MAVDPFPNPPIDVTGLPPLDDEAFEPLHPSFLRVRLLGDAIFAGVVVVAGLVLALTVSPWWVPVLVAAALLALTALTAWLQTVEVGHIGYLVRDKDFSYRRGVISHNVTTVPYARVQHVSIDRGPLARAFGLATLQMQTAGDGLTVPGVGDDTAQRLKALIVDRAGVAADEELGDQPGGADAIQQWERPVVDR